MERRDDVAVSSKIQQDRPDGGGGCMLQKRLSCRAARGEGDEVQTRSVSNR